MCVSRVDSRAPQVVRVFAVLWVAVAIAAWPTRAHGSETTWPLEHVAETLLSFGESYPAGDGDATHRGIDLAAAPEARVFAPTAGTVAFVGTVPGVGGGTVTAVTLATSSGVSVTLLPLSSVGVRRGDVIGAGEALATVAVAGDGSSTSTHLHVGVRRQDVYLDPATLLAPPSPMGDIRSAPAQPASAADPARSTAGPESAKTTGAPALVGAASTLASAVEPKAESGSVRPPVTSPTLDSAGAAVGTGVAASLAGQASVEGAHELALLPSGQDMPDATAVTMHKVGGHVRASGSSSVVANAAAVASRIAGNLDRVWRAALLGTLIGLAALWPVWRREQEEKPEAITATGGNDVAAVAGRC